MPIGFVTLPIITKQINVNDYGVWTMFITLTSLIMPFTGLSLSVALSRFLPGEKNPDTVIEAFSSVILFKLLVTIIFSSILILFADDISRHFFDNQLYVVYACSLYLVITTLRPVLDRMLIINGKTKSRSIIRITDAYMGLIGIAISLYYGFGLKGMIIVFLITGLVTNMIYLYIVINQNGIKIPNFKLIKKYLLYSLPYLPASLSLWIVDLTDRFIINHILGIVPLGIFAACITIGRIPKMASVLLNYIILVSISKLYDEGKIGEVVTHIQYTLKYYMLICIPMIFGSYIISEDLLIIFTNDDIASSGSSLIPLITTSFFIFGIYNTINQILLLNKKTKYLAYIWGLALPMNIFLNFVLIPILDLQGAVISTLTTYLFVFFSTYVLAKKLISIKLDFIFLAKSLFSSLSMCLILLIDLEINLLNLLLKIIICVLIYFILMIVIKSFEQKEIHLIRSLLSLEKQNK
ncbi:MAG: hypothetical protein CMM02_06355 [Rhodopirellula sp.]|nr:hypothetical protein [Rhodopirellula sp.]|tara:strand:+ start:569 stop:1966 length:1398 start_codon:yes stop_codon:yes gene_type:complete